VWQMVIALALASPASGATNDGSYVAPAAY
jgi:hypothetical protein